MNITIKKIFNTEKIRTEHLTHSRFPNGCESTVLWCWDVQYSTFPNHVHPASSSCSMTGAFGSIYSLLQHTLLSSISTPRTPPNEGPESVSPVPFQPSFPLLLPSFTPGPCSLPAASTWSSCLCLSSPRLPSARAGNSWTPARRPVWPLTRGSSTLHREVTVSCHRSSREVLATKRAFPPHWFRYSLKKRPQITTLALYFINIIKQMLSRSTAHVISWP